MYHFKKNIFFCSLFTFCNILPMDNQLVSTTQPLLPVALQEQFFNACIKTDDTLDKFCNTHYDINFNDIRNKEGQTGLLYAAQSGKWGNVFFFLENKMIDPTIACSKGKTVLWEALNEGIKSQDFGDLVMLLSRKELHLLCTSLINFSGTSDMAPEYIQEIENIDKLLSSTHNDQKSLHKALRFAYENGLVSHIYQLLSHGASLANIDNHAELYTDFNESFPKDLFVLRDLCNPVSLNPHITLPAQQKERTFLIFKMLQANLVPDIARYISYLVYVALQKNLIQKEARYIWEDVCEHNNLTFEELLQHSAQELEELNYSYLVD